MTGNDVAAILGAANSTNTFGENWIWIIGLLIVAGIFGGGVFGYGNGAVAAGLTRAEMDSEFVQRDIFNVNSNVLENKYASAMGECQTQKEVIENRYANQLGVQSILSNQAQCCCENRTEALKNTYELSQLADRNNFNTLLGNKDLTATIIADGEKTRALMISQYEAGLLEQINDLKAQVSNSEQTQTILNTMGRWHGYLPCGNSCGCSCSANLI